MSSAKVIALTKVINGLKDSHPDLNYQLLPQLNIKLDSTCIDKSDDIKDLREAVKFLKFPILEPIKEVISKMIDEKKKLTTSSPRLEKLMKLLETDNEMEIDSETSTSSTKKQKKQNVVDKKKKLTTSSPRLEKLMKLLETDNEMEIDSETSTSSTKKQKKQNVVDKP